VCRYDGKSILWLYEDHLTNLPNGGSFGIRAILEDKNENFGSAIPIIVTI